MFHKMPFILLLVIILGVLAPFILPNFWVALFYTISLSIKSLLIFILPFLIFSLIFKTTISLARAAGGMIFAIIGLVCVSNFISTMISYQVGNIVTHFNLHLTKPGNIIELAPLWKFSLPSWVSNAQAMGIALLTALLLQKIQPKVASTVSVFLEKCVSLILNTVLYLIPFFIFGFIVKMSYEGVISKIALEYSFVFGCALFAVLCYLGFLYAAMNHFQFRKWIESLRNMVPAAIAGFGSMSSVAAMPLTIMGTEKNVRRKEIAGGVIPATVNIHLMGDCFFIPLFIFAILKTFGFPFPGFYDYFIFTLYFIMAKFSIAAVPGGGILVMLPIIEAQFGFSPEMLSLISALYILFDPVITTANILGNGALAQLVDRMTSRKGIRSLS